MGFWDFLKGSGEKEVKHTKQDLVLDESELKNWIKTRQSEVEKDVLSNVSEQVSEVKAAKKRLVKLVESLDVLKAPQEGHKKLRKIAVTSKPIYVKGMREELRRFGEEKVSCFEDFSLFHQHLHESLDRLGKLSFGPGRYLTVTFGQVVPDIQKELKTLLELKESLDEELKEKKKELDNVNLALTKAGERKKIQAELKSIKLELEKAKKEDARLRKELEEKETRKNRKADIQTSKYEGLLKQKSKVEDEHKSLCSKLHHLQSPLAKPVKKYLNLIERGEVDASKDEKIRLESFLTDDVECMFNSKPDERELLQNLIQQAVNAEVEGSDEKTAKRIRGKHEAYLNFDLDSFLKEQEELKEHLRKIKLQLESPQIKKSMAEREKINQDILQLKEEISQSKEHISTLPSQIASLQDEKNQIEKELEKMLSQLAIQKVEITWE